jgi:hypothetical protein
MRFFKAIISLILATGLVGCVSFSSIDDGEEYSDPVRVTVASRGNSDQCENAIQIATNLRNSTGDDDDYRDLPDMGSKQLTPDSVTIIRHDSQSSILDLRYEKMAAYVSQSTLESCYAAALATIWKAAGIGNASEKDFIQAVQDACRRRNRLSANYLQILSSAASVHDGRRYDAIAVKGSPFSWTFSRGHVAGSAAEDGGRPIFSGTVLKCHVLPPICFLASGTKQLSRKEGKVGPATGKKGTPQFSDRGGLPIDTITLAMDGAGPSQGTRWKSITNADAMGGIYPLRSANDMRSAMEQGAFLIAGTHDVQANHVVIVTGLHFAGESDRIDRLRILDPATPDQPERWMSISNGTTIRELNFVLAIWNV